MTLWLFIPAADLLQSNCNQIYPYIYSLLLALVFPLDFPKHNGKKN